MTTLETVTISANDKQTAAKKLAVIENVLEKLPDDVFINVLYPKIQKDPNFLAKVMNNPLVKML